MQPASNPLVTVVIFCYSHISFFKRTFDSVMNQKTKYPVRVIVYDNGSAEGYRRLIDQTVAGTSAEIFREEKNAYGLGFRVNLLPTIQTKYIATIHDDDCYLPGKLEASLSLLVEQDLDFVVTNSIYIDPNDKEHDGALREFNFGPLKKIENPGALIANAFEPGLRLHFSTLVVSTQSAQTVSLGDPFYPRIADAFFWKALLTIPNIKFGILEQNLSAIRVHENNDRRYDKFDNAARLAELFKLSQSEIELFRSVLYSTDAIFMRDFVRGFLSDEFNDRDLVECLVHLSVRFSRIEHLVSRVMIAALAFHKAFELNAVEASRLLSKLTGQDANAYMETLYSNYFFQTRQLTVGTYSIVLRGLLLLFFQPKRLFGKVKDLLF